LFRTSFDLSLLVNKSFNVNLFEDTNLLKNRFHILEEDIIKLLDKMTINGKDLKAARNHHTVVLAELEQREHDLRKEKRTLFNAEQRDDKIIKKLNKKSTNEAENLKILYFINSIKNKAEGNFFDMKLLNEKKKNEDHLFVAKNTIDLLKVSYN